MSIKIISALFIVFIVFLAACTSDDVVTPRVEINTPVTKTISVQPEVTPLQEVTPTQEVTPSLTATEPKTATSMRSTNTPIPSLTSSLTPTDTLTPTTIATPSTLSVVREKLYFLSEASFYGYIWPGAPFEPSTPLSNDQSVAFSNFADRVLRVSWDEPPKLIVSSLGLETETVISDGVQYACYPTLWYWSPDDLHVLCDASSDTEPGSIYHIQSNTWEAWPYHCDRVARSPKTGNLAVWCPSLTAPVSFGVIEWGGKTWVSSEQPAHTLVETHADYNYPAWLWNWSANGDKFAYYDTEGFLVITDARGRQQAQFTGVRGWIPEKARTGILNVGISWAKNSNRLLVRALGTDQRPCPPNVSADDGSISEINPQCWQVINAENGYIIWTLGDYIPQSDHQHSQDFLYASLSSDGRLLALAAIDPPWREHAIIKIDTNEVVWISSLSGLPYSMRWGPNWMGPWKSQATATIPDTETTVPATEPAPSPTSTVALPTRMRTPVVLNTAAPLTTWTPAPTLSRSEAVALAEDLLENNGGCRLPCWWGMTPGKTGWQEAQHFLKTFVVRIWSVDTGASRKDGFAGSSHTVYYEGKKGESEFRVDVKWGKISRMVSGDATQYQYFMQYYMRQYSISPLLSEYGVPDEVFLRTQAVTNTFGLLPPFGIILDYRSQGFWAEYNLIHGFRDGIVRGCRGSGSGFITPRLFLFPPEQKWTDDEMFRATFDPPLFGVPPLPILSLKVATGMDLETFYQTFKDPSNQKCLETPARLWD